MDARHGLFRPRTVHSPAVDRIWASPTGRRAAVGAARRRTTASWRGSWTLSCRQDPCEASTTPIYMGAARRQLPPAAARPSAGGEHQPVGAGVDRDVLTVADLAADEQPGEGVADGAGVGVGVGMAVSRM